MFAENHRRVSTIHLKCSGTYYLLIGELISKWIISIKEEYIYINMIDGYICEYENVLIGHVIFVYELYVKITLCTHVHSVNDFVNY